MHKLAHPGVQATIKLISDRYIWFQMRKDIKTWVRNCEACQASKITRHITAPFIDIPSPDRFHTIHVDLVGPLPQSEGHRYLLTIVDRYTKWCEAIPLRNITAQTVTEKLIETWISRFGVPSVIITDCGRQFESELWRTLLNRLGIEWRHTTPYNPKANGCVERFHRHLKDSIRAHCGENPAWKKALPIILLGIRNTCSKELNNLTPSQLVFGTQLSLPGDFFSNCCEKNTSFEDLQRATQLFTAPNRGKYNQKRFFIPKDMETCTHVFMKKIAKEGLQRPYEGPYEILGRREKNFEIRKNNQSFNVNIDRLKPAWFSREEGE